MGVIFCALFQGHYKDTHEKWRLQLKTEKYRKLLFSSSKGIVHDPSKQPDFSKEKLWNQFIFGMKNFHPVLSIYYTHSLTISRPQRIMALMVVLLVNMFFDAMFFQVRHPDPNATADPFEALVFAMIISLVNVPICKFFESMYILAGSAYAAHVRYEVEAEFALKTKGLTFLAKVRRRIKTKRDAEDYIRLVEGYSRVVEKKLVKARTQQIIAPTETPHAKSARKRITALREDYKVLFAHKKAAYKKYFVKLKDEKVYQGRVTYALWYEAKAELQAAKRCCGSIQAYFLHLRKLKKKKKQEELDRLTHIEKKEFEVVKQKNFLLRSMYSSYKATNNPANHDPAPYGAWVFAIVDTFAVCVCLFTMYFILGFGIRYGPTAAEQWLTQFVTSILTTFIICDPLVIFIKSAVIPSVVHQYVLSHPDLIATGGVGQAAALVGMGAAAVGGAVGAAANKWRKKKKKPDSYDILDEDDEYDVDYDIVGNENITTRRRDKKSGKPSKYRPTLAEKKTKALDKRIRHKLSPILDNTILDIVMNLLVSNIFDKDNDGNGERNHQTSAEAKEELSKSLVESLGGNKSYMTIILELLNEDFLNTLRDTVRSTAATYMDNTPNSFAPLDLQGENHQHRTQLAESSIEYWIACGIQRATDKVVTEKREKERAEALAEVERSNKRIGKGVLNGLSRGGKKIRKSILHFRDHKKSGNKNNHKMMELINKEVALISKADKAIAEAKEQSNNYFDEIKAAKDERHKRMMQRRASRKNIREKTSKSGKKPPSISFKTNTPKISGITRQKTMIRKSP